MWLTDDLSIYIYLLPSGQYNWGRWLKSIKYQMDRPKYDFSFWLRISGARRETEIKLKVCVCTRASFRPLGPAKCIKSDILCGAKVCPASPGVVLRAPVRLGPVRAIPTISTLSSCPVTIATGNAHKCWQLTRFSAPCRCSRCSCSCCCCCCCKIWQQHCRKSRTILLAN